MSGDELARPVLVGLRVRSDPRDPDGKTMRGLGDSQDIRRPVRADGGKQPWP